MDRTDLQRHQQALSFDVGKAEVYAARVTVRISVAYDMRDLGVDLGDETVRQMLDPRMISLRSNKVSAYSSAGCGDPISKCLDSVPLHAESLLSWWHRWEPTPTTKLGFYRTACGISSQQCEAETLTAISCLQRRAASPMPTTNGGDRVPLRRPRS